ncbi:MAG: hypothetical protein DRP00_02575 [Candidatus Aenigmatarchaeota archaeon]|nr:MAG: hypothetical protein DRP00_02575 [Candidatus Aenigmarchaeota archaeon]
MEYLKSTEREALISVLHGLTIFIDHCRRSQLAYEDFKKNRGIAIKLQEYIRGRAERFSHRSGLCGVCMSVLAGRDNRIGLVLLSEIEEKLKPYQKAIKEIQEECINENCKAALKKAIELKEEILEKYF